MKKFTRRQFTAGSIALGMIPVALGADSKPPKRVGVIGHTGRGDYGHGLNTMWLGIPDCQIVAVADPDPKGLASMAKTLGGVSAFEDYRKLLAETKPDIVAIGMRHIDQHRDVALAAMEANVRGIYMEKPFCRTPGEADEILNAARSKNVKVAIAHRNRYHPVLPVLKNLLHEGVLGQVLEYRLRGKEDPRGGVLDLWVLGSHLMNLVNYFAGAPRSCTASIYQDHRLVTRKDAVQGAEGIGLMVGNEVHARFEMSNGLPAYFDSLANAGTKAAGFGIQIVGTEGIIDLRADVEPLAHLRRQSPFHPSPKPEAWTPITTAGIGAAEPIEELFQQLSKHWTSGRDLLQAIDENRQPMCSGSEAATTIEMITAVSTSHLLNGARVELPLAYRATPWG